MIPATNIIPIISYTLTEGGPVFAFRTIRGPDSAAVYNVDKDTLWHDQ